MKRLPSMLLALTFAAACTALAVAQDAASAPKILQINREYTKPGKGGALHDKTEGAFISATAKAKWPTHYLALNSMTGKNRVLYLTSYNSFADWQRDGDALDKNATLGAELDHAAVADGDLLDETDSAVLSFESDMSLHSMSDLSHMRYMSIDSYQVRPGHTSEWQEAVKMVKAGYEKADVGAHWAMYSLYAGGPGNEYLVMISRKSLSELDKGFQDDDKWAAAMGEEGMKKFSTLLASSVESSRHEIFAFNPRQSYVAEDWIKADPDFWKPKKPAMAAAKPMKEETKPKP